MADPGPMVADLRAESDDLDALVAPLAAARWADPTPSAGWTVAHQIGHLLWTDRVALISVTEEAGFAEMLTAAMQDPVGFVDAGAEELAATHRPPSCWAIGGPPGSDCTMRCSPRMRAGSCRGSGRQ